jgi:alpha-galactosidase
LCSGETGCGDECNAGDVLATLAYGFDSVKIDGCSSQHNTTLFAARYNDSGIPILIENCHDEQQPDKPIAEGGCSDYHTYRASTDIRNTYGSWVLNAYSVQQYTDGRTGPTCWAYSDMLMVGVGETCAGDTCAEPPLPSVTEQRTHFGLWCVISSPLTLSMDFANATLVDAAWPIVTNVAAIAVNQAWSGAPGGQLLADYTANVTLQHCTPGWAGDEPCTLPRTQVWWKPLPGGSAAIFMANHDDAAAHDVRLDFAAVPVLPCAPACEVTDVWQQAETGVHTGAYTATLQPHDSAFIVLHSAGAPWRG